MASQKKSIEASKDAKVANALRVVELDNVNLQHQEYKTITLLIMYIKRM
jgi:hypothetical protein